MASVPPFPRARQLLLTAAVAVLVTLLQASAAAVLVTLLQASAAAAQRPSPTVTVSQPGAPAGTEITVRVDGLTPGLRLQLGFGGLGTNHEILGSGAADENGNFQLAVKIPEWVERHRVYHFFVAYAGQPPRTVSDPFIATAADGFVRVTGNVSSAAPGCAQVRGFDETVYTLLGEAGALQSGARVVVEGTVGSGDSSNGAAGTCAQGPSIPVRVRQVLPG